MAILKVDEIEATSTDTNVKVSPKGTGIVEVKGSGGNSATVQLNCSAQSHGVKIKPPANSTGQNYTLVLPDNQIAQNKFVKVKSITGSGATAVGQLEYSDIPDQSIDNLNASNLTSGTVPSARFGSFAATSGAGFSLVNHQQNSSFNFSSVSFTSLEDNAAYKFLGEIQLTSSGALKIEWLDSSGNAITGCISYNKLFGPSNSYSANQNVDFINCSPGTTSGRFRFVAELFTKTGRPCLMLSGHEPRINDNQVQLYASVDAPYNNANANSSVRVHGVKFSNTSGSGNIIISGGITLFKYGES